MKKYIFIIITLLVVVIIAAIFTFSHVQNNLDKVLKDENIQVDTLIDIYKDAIERNKIDNLILGESALKNIITNENFKDENILKIKSIEKNDADSKEIYTLYVSYSQSKQIVTVTTIDDDSRRKNTNEYKLYIKNGKLEVENKGGTLLFTTIY